VGWLEGDRSKKAGLDGDWGENKSRTWSKAFGGKKEGVHLHQSGTNKSREGGLASMGRWVARKVNG